MYVQDVVLTELLEWATYINITRAAREATKQ